MSIFCTTIVHAAISTAGKVISGPHWTREIVHEMNGHDCIILQHASTRGIDGKDNMCLFIYNTVYTTVEEAKTTSLLLVKTATLPTDVLNFIAAEIQGTGLEVEQRKRHILKTSPDAVTGST